MCIRDRPEIPAVHRGLETIAAGGRQRDRPVDRARVGLSAMPDLLFLMQRLPYPLIKGEKVRNWHILNYLRKWYDVHFGCLIDDPADFQHIETVRALCKDMFTAPLDRARAKLMCATGLLTGEPLSVTFFRDRGL